MTTFRGYSAVGLFDPANPFNVGAVLRAAFVYGAAMVVAAGRRYERPHLRCDTPRSWRHMPFIVTDDILGVVPMGCTPIAVDMVPDAMPLPEFKHPERAFYIFGPEDGTLGPEITRRCHSSIFVQTRYCMNLAAAVNVVLYDRAMKRNEWPTRRQDQPEEMADA